MTKVERLSLDLYKLTIVGIKEPIGAIPYTCKVGYGSSNVSYLWMSSSEDIERAIHDCYRKSLIVKEMAVQLLKELSECLTAIVTITYEDKVCTIDSPYCLTEWLQNWFDSLGERGGTEVFSKRLNRNYYKATISENEFNELLAKLTLEGVEYRTPLPAKLI